MPDELLLGSLVTRAGNGDKQAWDMLVERCAPVVWSFCHRHGLSRQDADDVGRNVWLQLVERIGTWREPAMLTGIGIAGRGRAVQEVAIRDYAAAGSDEADGTAGAGRAGQTRPAIALAMLAADPPVPCAEISASPGIAVGNIGPSRVPRRAPSMPRTGRADQR
jgi:hypothetical protein